MADLPTELLVLLLAVLLAVVQLLLFAVPANMELEPGYTAGPRDTPPKEPLSARTARLQRAYNNHVETLPWFAIVVVVAHLVGTSDAITQGAAWTYLAARIAYVPFYASGTRWLRSIAWLVALLAILTILIRILLP